MLISYFTLKLYQFATIVVKAKASTNQPCHIITVKQILELADTVKRATAVTWV